MFWRCHYAYRLGKLAKSTDTRCYSSQPHYSHVYISTCHNIFYNLALEHWIYKNISFDNRNILLMWRNHPCVVFGRHQNPWLELDVNEANANKIDIVRRNSGGGTVYHDMGNMNLSFFATRKGYNRKDNLQVVVEALNAFGLDVQINDRDDLTIEGRKISGSAAKLGKTVSYHHCTLLLDANLKRLRRLLKPTMTGIESKATESIRSSCININILQPQLTYNNIMDAVSSYYLDKYSNSESTPQYVDPTNQKHFPGLFEIYQELTSWDWVYAKTPPFSIKRSFQQNGSQLNATLQIKKGVIDNVDMIVRGEDSMILGKHTDQISEVILGTKFCADQILNKLQSLSQSDEDFYMQWLISCVAKMCNVIS